MSSVDRAIWNKLRVKQHDNVPYCGWGATRIALAELFGELGFKRGAEIGVARGEYSEILCQKNPGLELFCIDVWAPNAKRRLRRAQEENFAQAKQRLEKFNAKLIRKASMDALGDVADGSLDFVYIDADHEFESVMLDIIHWSHKVRAGGIVSGHDYCWGYRTGVVAAVDGYVSGMGIQSWYLTNHDREPSWLWVKW